MGEIKILTVTNGYVVFWNESWKVFQYDEQHPAKATEDCIEYVASILGRNKDESKKD